MMRAAPLLLALALPSTPRVGQDAAAFRDQGGPFLARHCVDCHGEAKPKGTVRLDTLGADAPGRADEERWRAVLEQLASGAMPPKKKTRPPSDDLRAVTGWIERTLSTAETARRAAQGRVVLRRLNRVEYSNTLRDLLGVDMDFREMLALDGTSDGFDNVGSALHLSSFALERYLQAAEAALNLAIADRPAPPTIKKRFTLKDSHNVKLAGEPAFRVIDDTVVCFTSVNWHRVSLNHSAQQRGLYRYRICASGFQTEGKPATFEVTSRVNGLIGYFDVPADTPTVVEFTDSAEVNGQPPIALLPYGMGHPNAVKAAGVDAYTGPGLAVHWVEMEGPLYDAWPPAGHRAIFGDLPQEPVKGSRERLDVVSKEPVVDAERILRGFARRALRRPVTDVDLKPFMDLVRAALSEKDSFEQAVRVGLTAVLMSRPFLFLEERTGPLDDVALASRLSYFLWSTMPDEELLALAEEKKLGRPDTLRAQVERMLRSPKAAAFTKNFCGQWLGLREIDFTSPNHIAYPEFDEMLKVSMVREAELFFQEILEHDLPLTNFVSSDFSTLNGRLARHYGIGGVDGLWKFRKTALPADCHRGGVLTMAAVLKVTANGTSTSPITRGSWVLERILGTPPPKPPAGVAALEPDIRGAKTIREQLAKHRNDPSCATCHARIDPPGFALESFDVIGGWRESYRLSSWAAGAKPVKGKAYLEGAKVDPAGELADGRRFENIDELKALLLKDPGQIARALTRKLVTYATGGAPEAIDAAEIEAIVGRLGAQGYGLRALVHEIAGSRMFREK
jgi:hypothetical protein